MRTPGINFIKLCQKANGKKRKVASKLQVRKHDNQRKFCMKMFCEMAFLKRLFCHLSEKAARKCFN